MSFLFATVFIVNVFHTQCFVNGNLTKSLIVENDLKYFFTSFDKDLQTAFLISNLDRVDLRNLRFATVVLPLTISSLDNKRYIKVLSSAQKVLLTAQDDDLSLNLNATEKFLQKFWRQHKTTKIFVMERSVIYFFNPFIYDYEAEAFGSLQTTVKLRKFGSQKSFPIRVEVFASTYSEPYDWRDFSKGYRGPDIQIMNIVTQKMNFEGERRKFR